jgi:hypothetical protein
MVYLPTVYMSLTDMHTEFTQDMAGEDLLQMVVWP